MISSNYELQQQHQYQPTSTIANVHVGGGSVGSLVLPSRRTRGNVSMHDTQQQAHRVGLLSHSPTLSSMEQHSSPTGMFLNTDTGGTTTQTSAYNDVHQHLSSTADCNSPPSPLQQHLRPRIRGSVRVVGIVDGDNVRGGGAHPVSPTSEGINTSPDCFHPVTLSSATPTSTSTTSSPYLRHRSSVFGTGHKMDDNTSSQTSTVTTTNASSAVAIDLQRRKRTSLENAMDTMNDATVRRLEKQRALLQAEEHLTDDERRNKRLEEECLIYTRTVCGDGLQNKGLAELAKFHEEKRSAEVGVKMDRVGDKYQSRLGRWRDFVKPIRASEKNVKKAYAVIGLGNTQETNKLLEGSSVNPMHYGVGTLKPLSLPTLTHKVMSTECRPFAFSKKLGQYVTQPTSVAVAPDAKVAVVNPPAFIEAPLPRMAIRSDRSKGILGESSDNDASGGGGVGTKKKAATQEAINKQMSENDSQFSAKARKSLFKDGIDDKIPRVPYQQVETHLIARLRSKCPLEGNGCTKATNDRVIDAHRHFRIPITRSVNNVSNRRLLQRQGDLLVIENDTRLQLREKEMFHSVKSKHRFNSDSLGAFSVSASVAFSDDTDVFGGSFASDLPLHLRPQHGSNAKSSVTHNSFKDFSNRRRSVAVSITLPDSWDDPTPVPPHNPSATPPLPHLQHRHNHRTEEAILKQEQEQKAQAQRNRLVVSPRTYGLIKDRGPQTTALDVLEGLTDALESNLFWELNGAPK